MNTTIAATDLMMTRGLGRKTLASLINRIAERGGILPDGAPNLASVLESIEKPRRTRARTNGERLLFSATPVETASSH